MESVPWDDLLKRALKPTYLSGFGSTDEDRDAFIEGAYALGLVGRGKTLKPQQLLLCEVLDAGHRFTTVLMPRRSAKTTTLIAWGIGRCLMRDDYLVAYTVCTSGKKARDRAIKDVFPILDRVYPNPDTRPFKLRRAAGQERIEFDNGSIFQIVAPIGDDFRSDAFDVIILDEAGEATVEMGEDLLAAALPTQDTRPGAMLVVAGTAGKYRAGNLLWDSLEDGRRGDAAILEYSIDDYVTAEDTTTWEQMVALLADVHPGLGTLTTVESLELNFKKMGRELFVREYLGQFGLVGTTSGVIPPLMWAETDLNVTELPAPPDRFSLAIACHPNQTSAVIVAAWREGREGRLLVLDHREGMRWLADRAAELSRKYGVPITYDPFGPLLVEVERMQQMKPRPRLDPVTMKEATTAAAKLVEEVSSGRTRHYGQEVLTHAALLARKRAIGPKAWAFGRSDPDDDISPLEAAALALRAYDESRPKAKVTILRPTG